MPRRRGRHLLERQRLIVHVVTHIGRRRLEIRLELERWHFDDVLARPGGGGGGRTTARAGLPRRRGWRALGRDGLHARRFRSRRSRPLKKRNLERGLRRLRRWRRVDDVAFEYQVGTVELDPLIRLRFGNRGFELGHGLEVEIGRVQLLADGWRGRALRPHLPEVRDCRLEALQHPAARTALRPPSGPCGPPGPRARSLIDETGGLDLQRLIRLGHDFFDELLGSGRRRSCRRWRSLRSFRPAWLVEVEKDETGRLPLPRLADVVFLFARPRRGLRRRGRGRGYTGRR